MTNKKIYTIIDAETKKQAINDLKALIDRWEDDNEMYTKQWKQKSTKTS